LYWYNKLSHTKTEELQKANEEIKYLEETKDLYVDEIEKYEKALKVIFFKRLQSDYPLFSNDATGDSRQDGGG